MLGLCVHTAECVVEHIDSEVKILPEIHTVFDNKSFISTSLGVTLVKSAPVLGRALTFCLAAVKDFKTL